MKYRRNAMNRLREYEEQWKLFPDDLNIFRQLNRERIRLELEPITLPARDFYLALYDSDLFVPQMWITTIDHLQFPAYEVRKDIAVTDILPVLPQNIDHIKTIEQIIKNAIPIIIELGWVALLKSRILKNEEIDWSFPYHDPGPPRYPDLYLVPRTIIQPSGDSNICKSRNDILLADQWIRYEDPRSLENPRLRRGHYPVKVVLFYRPTGSSTDRYITWLCIVPYDQENNPNLINGHYDMDKIEGYTDYLVRLLHLSAQARSDKWNQYEIFF